MLVAWRGDEEPVPVCDDEGRLLLPLIRLIEPCKPVEVRDPVGATAR
jgi:hypothetical protein